MFIFHWNSNDLTAERINLSKYSSHNSPTDNTCISDILFQFSGGSIRDHRFILLLFRSNLRLRYLIKVSLIRFDVYACMLRACEQVNGRIFTWVVILSQMGNIFTFMISTIAANVFFEYYQHISLLADWSWYSRPGNILEMFIS